jgi:hypothetical protein
MDTDWSSVVINFLDLIKFLPYNRQTLRSWVWLTGVAFSFVQLHNPLTLPPSLTSLILLKIKLRYLSVVFNFMYIFCLNKIWECFIRLIITFAVYL